jgi:ketosteroid isomerase-like protein
VWIEHGEVRVEGRADYVPIVIRVTHVFRRQAGVWKIIHRHGDSVVEKTVATAILQRP